MSGIFHTATMGGKDVVVDDHVCGNKSPGEGGRASGDNIDVNMERCVGLINYLICSRGL